MKILLFCLGLILSLISRYTVFSQVEYIWDTTYGGSNADLVSSLIQSYRGDFYIIGSTLSSDFDVMSITDPDGNSYHGGNGDAWIVKLDSNGILIWQNALGGTNADGGVFGSPTYDQGLIFVGHTYSNDGDIDMLKDPDSSGNHGAIDMWVVKMDSNGLIEWQNTLGGTGIDFGHGIKQTKDNGYIVIGHTYSNDGDIDTLTDPDSSGNHGAIDMWVVKLDSNGRIEWQNALGGTGDDVGLSLALSHDGGYLLSGVTFSSDGDINVLTDPDNSTNHGISDLWVVKLDSNGRLEWQNALGGSGIEGLLAAIWGHGYCPILQNDDSSIVVATATTSLDGDLDISNDVDGFGHRDGLVDYWLVKLDKNGQFVWGNVFGAAAISLGDEEEVFSLIKNNKCGGYIVSGDTYSAGINGDKTDPSPNNMSECTWLVWLGEDGDIIADKTTGSGGIPDDLDDEGGYIIATNNGKYALAISSMNDPGYNKTATVKGPSGFPNADFWFVLLDLNFSPNAEFDYSNPCLGDSTLFKAKTTLGLSSFEWDFGDFSTFADTFDTKNTNYLYPDTGYYDVKLIVILPIGASACSDTNIQTIHISPLPELVNILDTTICIGDTISLTAQGATTYEWNPFSEILCDTCSDNQFFPSDTSQYILKGFNSNKLCFNVDTFTINTIPLPKIALPNDTGFCMGDSITITIIETQDFIFYWSNGDTGITTTITDSGKYWVMTQTNDLFQCTSFDTIEINQKPLPKVNLGEDTIICIGGSIMIDVFNPDATYLWHDNTTLPTCVAGTKGLYFVAVNLEGCVRTDSINIDTMICKPFQNSPQAFSPNGDGNNEIFIPFYENISALKYLKIYNRWGDIIFVTDQKTKGWDGTYQGKLQETGTYLYRLIAIALDGSLFEQYGTIFLIR